MRRDACLTSRVAGSIVIDSVIVDVVIVGGGLAGSLAAWRLATAHPSLSVRLVEGGPRLGGNHTWSFHDTDLSPGAHHWVAPLVAARWPRHEVRFPRGSRVLSGAYLSITSSRLHEVIAPALGARLHLGARVAHLGVHSVTLESGDEIQARLVIDARGALQPPVPVGWQTFVGQELELEADHGLEQPILMDATVPQVGGFRFVYVLPWTARCVLVEDTLYADTPAIDHVTCRQAIADYVDTPRLGRAPDDSRGSRQPCRYPWTAAARRSGRTTPCASGCVPACSTPPPATRCPMRWPRPICWRRSISGTGIASIRE